MDAKRKISVFFLSLFCLMMSFSAYGQTITDKGIKIEIEHNKYAYVGTNYHLKIVYKDSDSIFHSSSLDNADQYLKQITSKLEYTFKRKGITIVFGPSKSQQESYTVKDGHTSKSKSLTFTYLLRFSKEGTYIFPVVSIDTPDGEVISPDFHVEVLSMMEDPLMQQEKRSVVPEKKYLVLKTSVDKKHVNLGDTVECEYRIYTNLDLTQLNGFNPIIDNACWKEIELPSEKSFEMVFYEGDSVKSVLCSKYAVIPLQAGEICINPVELKGIYVIRDPDGDPFERFFNGGSAYMEKDTVIYSNPITILVDKKNVPERDYTFELCPTPHSLGICIDRSTSMNCTLDTCDLSLSYYGLEKEFLDLLFEGKEINNNGITLFAGIPHFPTPSEIDSLMNVFPSADNDGSAIYDAILASAIHEGAMVSGHQPFSVLLLTDGSDNHSRISEKTLTNLLLRHQIRVDVVVFTTQRDSLFYDVSIPDENGIVSKQWVTWKPSKDYANLQRIAEATNGLFLVIDDPKQIQDAVNKTKEAMANGLIPERHPEDDFSPNPILLNTIYKELLKDATTPF